jgi:quinoprotein glucose dehydrogenase
MRKIYTCTQAAVSLLRPSIGAEIAFQLHRIAACAASLRCAAALLCAAALCGVAVAQAPDASDWGAYGGNAFGQRFSSLDEVNRTNVTRLDVAWIYRTGELGTDLASGRRMAFEATPVLAFGLLYLETPTNIVIALDPDTGKERWRYDPRIKRTRAYAEVASRGVSVWQDREAKEPHACVQRVFTGTLDARLIALDARTGAPCADFGSRGQVDLTADLRMRDVGDYQVTSPPAIYGSNVIVGSAIESSRATDVERGVIRAFDARTGARIWTFDPLPDAPDHPAAGEWRPEQAAKTGGGSAWGVMSVDADNGLVLVPTGSASPAYFGGDRIGSNRLANSLLALDARSGKLLWSHQLVHHDLWSLDVAAQPVLADIEIQGVPRPAVVQATRSGMLYVLERTRGEELFPIIEKPVPVSPVPDEQSWPTQPFSQLPALVPQEKLRPEDAWGITFWDRDICRQMIASHRNEGIFTPPDLRGTITLPGHMGGVDWGGIAFDEDRQRVIAAVNLMPEVVTLVPREQYAQQLRSGQYPGAEFAAQEGTPYGVRREPLLSPWGLPCTAPPWGALINVDLRRNRIIWKVPLGSTTTMGPRWAPTRDFGVPLAGGPIATAGDLVFVAATIDGYLRAFDIETGRELWKHPLKAEARGQSTPTGGQSTPMTYRAGHDQRQYIVICAGGSGPLGAPTGDYVIAFALPRLPGSK